MPLDPQLQKLADDLIRDLTNAANNAMQSGLHARVVAGGLRYLAEALDEVPFNSDGQISLYGKDGTRIAGPEVPQEKIREAAETNASILAYPIERKVH